ncbi:MAG: rRNA maturation RNase YbeY [Halanaerobiales bacterium]
MIKVQINNKLSDIEGDKYSDLFNQLAGEAARLEGYDNAEVSVVFTDNEQIRDLNKKYRNKNEPTDVLSFPLDDNLLGDIIISIERAREQAEEYGHSEKREICYLFVHGLLHLFGYEHSNEVDKKQMRKKEERILSARNISRE